ncbi:MAG TPA: biopolymer transporter Tol, partial [Opitutaceae bacterium]|nr:biopolymer transporter Tol [Opitutaceae bacterium]
MRASLLFLLLPVTAALAQVHVGTVEITADRNSTPIRISGEPAELVNLARVAFDTDGAFRRVAEGEAYDFVFTQAGPAQVRLEILRGAGREPVYSEEVSGSGARNALLRAADVAVERTSHLRGFFAGKLAFISERGNGMEIMTSDLFGSEVVGWPGVSRQIVTPRWSPDGGRLIFTSYRNGFPDIYLLDLATRVPATFVSVRGTNTGGRFSPEGSRVAMVLSGEGSSELYVSNAQGKMISRLTR